MPENKHADKTPEYLSSQGIQKEISEDPYEGIDFGALSLLPGHGSRSPEDDEIEDLELREINPITGVDMADLSILFETGEFPDSGEPAMEEINLTGIDIPDLSLPSIPPRPAELPIEKAPTQPISAIKTEPETVKTREEPKAEGNNRKPDTPQPVASNGRNDGVNAYKAILHRAYRYSEITRIREQLSNALNQLNPEPSPNGKKANCVLVTSPHDGAGNTLLVSVLGYNAAFFEKMSVLLVDLNMRRPQLHLPFGLEQAHGFTDIIQERIPWKDAIKSDGLKELRIITAGQPDNQLSSHLNRTFLEKWIREVQKSYDLVIFDSSPVLTQNRNNVDTVFLSQISDWVILGIQENKTTRTDLKNAVATITKGGGKINGIVYNQLFKKDVLPKKLRQLISRTVGRG